MNPKELFDLAIRSDYVKVHERGGIACHVAIIFREMRIPCVIGTKVATKILKDNDLVEVDADKGIIKVIK